MKLLNFKHFSMAALLGSTVLVAAYCPKPVPTTKEAILMRTLNRVMSQLHFSPLKLDDEFSKKVFALYLDRIDGRRNFLTQEDVNKMNTYETKIDDELNNDGLSFFELSTSLLQNGMNRAEKFYQEAIAAKHDFSIQENITLGEKRKFEKDDAAMREHWRKLMKYDILTRYVGKLDSKAEGKEPNKNKSDDELLADATKETKKTYDEYFKRLHKQKRSDRFEIYLNAITNVFDPHTEYFEPVQKQNFDLSMSGRLIGIGARLQFDPETELTKVIEIIVGGPAWKQKNLKEGDLIMKVAQGDKEPVEVTGMEIDEVVSMIRGKEKTEVRLTVKSKDGTIHTIPIVREEVIFDEGFAKSLILQADEKSDKIGYIKLPKFYADFEKADGHQCSEDVRVEVEKLKAEGVKGIILDLRNNGGGSLRDVVEMSGLFIEKGPIVQVKARDSRPEILNDDDETVQYNGAFVIMVNQFSASASEIMAAAMQDYGRAIVVGTNTYGKGTVQRFFNLDRAYNGGGDSIKPLGEVKITIQKFFRVNGGSTQLKGVAPDIVLPDTYMELKTGEDENEHPMRWSEISSVAHNQSVMTFKKDKVVDLAKKRIANNPTFKAVVQNAKRVKANRDRDVFTLNLSATRAEEKKRQEEGKQFEGIFKSIEAFKVSNITEDMPAFNADASKKARNGEWIKDIKKDAHIYETLAIIRDLIDNSTVAMK
jgi:carboxyl-terminal processing protease